MVTMNSNPTKFAPDEGTPEGTHSALACKLCRQRKIKCTRELPYCLICQRAAQQCQYPETVKRPGPRIGYVQPPRRKAEGRAKENVPKNRKRRLSHISNCDTQGASDWEETSVARPENVGSSVSQKTHSLSLIIHPWHESYVPEQGPSPQSAATCSPANQPNNIASSCILLGVKLECLDVL